jgi:hypothetical protein
MVSLGLMMLDPGVPTVSFTIRSVTSAKPMWIRAVCQSLSVRRVSKWYAMTVPSVVIISTLTTNASGVRLVLRSRLKNPAAQNVMPTLILNAQGLNMRRGTMTPPALPSAFTLRVIMGAGCLWNLRQNKIWNTKVRLRICVLNVKTNFWISLRVAQLRHRT